MKKYFLRRNKDVDSDNKLYLFIIYLFIICILVALGIFIVKFYYQNSEIELSKNGILILLSSF